MFPFSFAEYLNANENKDEREAFSEFINMGGFPIIATELNNNIDLSDKYLEGIYNTILIKDVVTHRGISDIDLLKNIVKYLCSNIGSLISLANITDYINNTGRKITQKTVSKYVEALTDSFLFYNVQRFNIKGKNLLKTIGKYYIVDTGLRNYLLSTINTDIGHQIENIVYLELRRRGYRVNIGKVDNKEIDFVATKLDSKEYYQVSASVLDKDVFKREISSLEKINDNYPKFLLTLDDFEGTYEGIKQVNLRKWLLQE